MASVYGKMRFVVNKEMINIREREEKPLAGSPFQSKPVGFASSPFEERLPPRRGKMSRSDKRRNLAR